MSEYYHYDWLPSPINRCVFIHSELSLLASSPTTFIFIIAFANVKAKESYLRKLCGLKRHVYLYALCTQYFFMFYSRPNPMKNTYFLKITHLSSMKSNWDLCNKVYHVNMLHKAQWNRREKQKCENENINYLFSLRSTPLDVIFTAHLSLYFFRSLHSHSLH